MRQLKITQSITNRESMSLEKYLQEIGNEEILTPEEEVELAQRIKKGDKQALDRLVKANLRFVVSVAKQYQTKNISLPDLINEGNLGLLKAAERFDATRGFKFISYAVWWIRQSILQAIATQGRLIRIPANQIGVVNKVNRVLHEFEQKNERMPNIDELVQDMDMAEEHIVEALSLSYQQVSVDSPFKGDESSSLLDILPATDIPSTDKHLMEESLKDEIKRTFKFLTAREQEVITAYFGINGPELTLEEIGLRYQLSRERVRQIKEKAISRLRKKALSANLKWYLG